MSTINSNLINIKHLFRPLNNLLIDLLDSLSEEDWHKQTVAKKWKVKDVVSHLLDGNIGALSIQRDRYFGVAPPKSDEFRTIVNWLNDYNAKWVDVSKRISPSVLILLHKATSHLVCDYYESVDLHDESVFAVSWAGEQKSLNWMHLAREYTEKWHHQQQIREATDKEGIMNKEFFYPCIDIFFRALPHTFRNIQLEKDTLIKIKINSEIGGNWFLNNRNDSWELTMDEESQKPDTIVKIPPEISWKLFTKSLRPKDVRHKIEIDGNQLFGEKVLEMVSVMA